MPKVIQLMKEKCAHLTSSRLFWGGVLLKVLLACFFASDYLLELFIPFVQHYVSDPFENPYTFFVNNGQETAFPYPPIMLWILAVFKAVFGPLIAVLPLTQPDLLTLRLPVFLADFLILYTMSKSSYQFTRKYLIYYWLNPILIYINYIHGQLDVIPISLLFIATYFLYKQRFISSAVLLGLGCATKTHLILVVPLFLLSFPASRRYIKHITQYTAVLIAVIALCNLPFMSMEYLQMVYQNKEQVKLFSIQISYLKGLNFYLIPSVILFLYLRFFLLKSKSKDAFFAFLTFCFSTLLIFIPPMPGWYYWMVPFLIMTSVHNRLKLNIFAALLVGGYFSYFLFSPQSDFIDVFQVMFPHLDAVPPLFFQLQAQSPVLATGLHNMSFTLLQSSLLFICVWIYVNLTTIISKNKISSQPLLIGISGNSGTGKTRLAGLIRSIFGETSCSVFHGDDLHRWERGNENWESYTHLNPKSNFLYQEVQSIRQLMSGNPVYRRFYNHDTGRFSEPKKTYPNNIMIFEGLHTFYLQSLEQRFDIKFFLEPHEPLRKHWKILRDVTQRNHKKEDIVKSIEKRQEDAQKYIKEQAQATDVIIRWQTDDDIKELGEDNNLSLYLDITLSNALSVEQFVAFYDSCKGVTIDHHFIEGRRQQIVIKGCPNQSDQQTIRDFYEEKLYHLGLFQPQWTTGLEGVIQVFISEIILDNICEP